MLLVAGVAALLLLAAGAWYLTNERARSQGDGPVPGQPGQRTLLIQATDAEGRAASSALLGVDAAGNHILGADFKP